MGVFQSRPLSNPVNYDCPVCKSTGKLPNIAGKFHLINETQCQCNGCQTIFDKATYYKTGNENDNDSERTEIDGTV